MTPKPNFFIVGAPKCGTTAMYTYLKVHPDVFMPYEKEPHFFATDLRARRYERYRSLEAYLALFADAKSEKRVGEASVLYLYSRVAAHNIREFDPAAKIIIMLRNPVDTLYSFYGQLVYSGEEDIATFDGALAAEPDRKQGRRLPAGMIGAVDCLYYREMVRFAGQVQRYFDVFGRDAVHIIIYDDFQADTMAAYRETLKYLDIDPGFTVELKVINQNKRPRNLAMRDFLKNPPDWYVSLLRVGRATVPQPLRHGITRSLARINSQVEPRRPMDRVLRQQLQAEFLPEVERLSTVLDRDLTHWCAN